MTIILVLLAFSIPAFHTMTRSLDLTNAAEMLRDSLIQSRQIALAQNRPVEFRFYKLSEPTNAANKSFCGFQAFQIDETGLKKEALDKIRVLPSSIAISQNDTRSSLINATPTPLPTENLPAFGVSEYFYFNFRPDGSTDLDTTGAPSGEPWFVSLFRKQDIATGQQTPANFITLQINPVTGEIQTFQPGS